MTGPFERCTADDIARLIDAHPLAWVIAPAPGGAATPLPMLLDRDGHGHIAGLTGHVPKAHPLFAQLTADPRAMFLFQGPQAYISPEPLSNRDWAPTWNFAVVRIDAEVHFDDALTDIALRRLVTRMEAGRARPWTVEELGGRYTRMRDQVIGFSAAIHRIVPRFKLGQDEQPAAFDEIVDWLGDSGLADWMRRFKRDRG